MVFRKYICLAVMVGIGCSQFGLGQDRQYAEVPAPSGTDPFVLTPGSSFSASNSGTRPVTVSPSARLETIAADFDEAVSIITKNHVGGKGIRTESLTESAITSMLHVLDPHSNFYSAVEFQELLGEHQSEYSGTGSSIAGFERNGRIETYVISTMPDSPAAKARLRFGDRIIAVDGRPVEGEIPDVIRDLVRGKRGSSVRLTVERADTLTTETVEMKRDRVHEPAVPKGFLLSANIGYIDLTSGFSNSTFSELETALADLNRRGMTSLILDVRGNGGGILEQAVKVAEKFLPVGTTIVSQRGRYSDDNRTWKAAKSRYESMPLVLLVDENSASASEVLAGALQDNDRALIVGQKTFGKGLVQSVLNLPNGTGLTLTAARYFTPAGRSIQRDYADTGLYDYFNHRTAEARIDKPLYAARTITNRVVYGGNGITPDEITAQSEMTPERYRLLDPIFFFSREFVNGRIAGTPAPESNTAQNRGSQTVGGSAANDDLLTQFYGFVDRNSAWSALRKAAGSEKAFIVRMLRYYTSIGASGIESANQIKIESDPQVRQAINTLPQAARLAAAAQKARNTPKKEKSPLSLVLNELR